MAINIIVLSGAQRQLRLPRITLSLHGGKQASSWARSTLRPHTPHTLIGGPEITLPCLSSSQLQAQDTDFKEIKEKACLPVSLLLDTDGRGLPTQLLWAWSSPAKPACGRENKLSLCQEVAAGKWLTGWVHLSTLPQTGARSVRQCGWSWVFVLTLKTSQLQAWGG